MVVAGMGEPGTFWSSEQHGFCLPRPFCARGAVSWLLAPVKPCPPDL